MAIMVKSAFVINPSSSYSLVNTFMRENNIISTILKLDKKTDEL